MRYGRDYGARRTPWDERGPDRDRVAHAQRFHYSAAYGGLENDPQYRYERERGTGPARGPIGFGRPGRRGYDRGFGGVGTYRAGARGYDRDLRGRSQGSNLRQHGRGFVHDYDRPFRGGPWGFSNTEVARRRNPLV